MSSEAYNRLINDILRCGRCPLHEAGLKLVGEGDLSSGVMVIGRSPTLMACKAGKRHTLPDGRPSRHRLLLNEVLEKCLNKSLDEVYLTDLVKCPLPKGRKRLTSEQLSSCLQFLNKELRIGNPKLIITLGSEASRKFIPHFRVMRLDHGKLLRRIDGITVIPIYHPAYAVKFEVRGVKELIEKDLAQARNILEASLPQ